MEKNKYVVYNLDKYHYWVSKGKATREFEKATKFDSIEEVIKNVPLMKDWNIDYDIYECKGKKEIKIDELEWIKIHRDFEKNEPDEYNKLYKENIWESLIVEVI